MKSTPLILEAQPGHATYELGSQCPYHRYDKLLITLHSFEQWNKSLKVPGKSLPRNAHPSGRFSKSLKTTLFCYRTIATSSYEVILRLSVAPTDSCCSFRKRVGQEVFRYHGTARRCTLGNDGNTQLCTSTACPLCSILRTSFKVSLANPTGA